ncbi:cleavage and polyadenylation specificity factor subunit 2 [Bonamia ostreae]|uniref:Cleavage and polyadenylation specificity factor subunit 2 n=1 Tax=Bonamia ostreae TaxID=126728 RepID=A0ABV2ATW9_9EUKA
MGLMTMYDAFQNATSNNKQFTHFTIDDVDFAANLFVPLKFCQPFRLTGNGEGIQISAINAGNVLGGTIWRISRESDEVVYAVDFNHKIERHLDRSHIETIFRPSLLITDCLNFDLQHQPRSKRDAELIKSVMACLVGGGDVLLPVDAAGRSLELLLLLHSHWKINALVGRFSLVFLAHTARHSIDFANSMLEWTNGRCQKEFDASKRSPFDFEF